MTTRGHHGLMLNTGGVDPFFSSVRLLAQFIGANGSTTFIDQSNAPHSLSAAGNAQIQSNKLELDGAGDWVTSPDSADWVLSGDFTWEVFGVSFDTVSTFQSILSQYDVFSPGTNQRSWWIIFRGDLTPKKLSFVASTLGTSGSTTTPIDADFPAIASTNYDICLERSGSVLRLYVNGSMIGTASYASATFNSTSPLAIGAENTRSGGANSNELDGRLSAVRYTLAARYASDSGYVVPTLPLPTS